LLSLLNIYLSSFFSFFRMFQFLPSHI
jgi:hypothetical protein